MQPYIQITPPVMVSIAIHPIGRLHKSQKNFDTLCQSEYRYVFRIYWMNNISWLNDTNLLWIQNIAKLSNFVFVG